MAWFALKLLLHQAWSYFFIMSSMCFSVIFEKNMTLKNILQNNHNKIQSLSETYYRFGIWIEHKSLHQSFMHKFTTGKSFYFFSGLAPPPPNLTILHAMSLRDPRLSSHLPGQLKCKVTLQLVLKSITALLHCSCGAPDERSWREIFSALFFDSWTWQAWGEQADLWSTLLHLSRGRASLFLFSPIITAYLPHSLSTL